MSAADRNYPARSWPSTTSSRRAASAAAEPTRSELGTAAFGPA